MESMDDSTLFLEMAGEFPIRTALFTFAVPLFSLALVANGFLYRGAVEYIVPFSVAVIAYSAVLTRYQMAEFRRQQVVGDWRPDD